VNKKRELIFGLGILFLCALGILFLNLKTKNDLEYEKSIDNKFLDTAILQSLENKQLINESNYCENMSSGTIENETDLKGNFYDAEFIFRECYIDKVRYINKTNYGIVVKMKIYKKNKNALNLIRNWLEVTDNYNKDANIRYYFTQIDGIEVYKYGSAIFPRIDIELRDNEYIVPVKNVK
jgi:hypothetical protein